MSASSKSLIPRRQRLLEIGLGLLLILAAAGCSRSPEENYARFMNLGKQQFDAGDFNRAILNYRNAVQAKSDKADGHYELALAYLAANRVPEGADELRRTTELDPQHSKAQLKLAELMIRTRDANTVNAAAERLQTVLKNNPSDLDALYELASTEAQLGRPEQAEKLLGEILLRSPEDLRSILGIAQMKAGKKDFDGAIQGLTEFLQKSPNSSGAEAALGTVYGAKGDLANAETHLLSSLRIDPNNAPALILLATTQMQAGKKPEAEATYKRLSQLPKGQYKMAYADFLSRQNRTSDAIQELERIRKSEPNDVDVRSRLVGTYILANRRDAAQKLLNDALQKNPKDAEALFQRSGMFLDEGRFGDAEADVNSIYKTDPGSVRARFMAAHIYAARGDLIRARAELTTLLETAPESIVPRLDLARLLLAANNVQAAQQTLNSAPAHQKQTAAFAMVQTWIWIAEGNKADARRAVNAVLTSARIPEALIQDGILKMVDRDLPGARKSLEEALASDPEDLRALGALVQSYPRGQEAAALEKIRAVVSRKPNSYRLQLFSGQWMVDHAKSAEARTALLAAKAADPKQTAPDVLLARIDVEDKNLQAARDRLKPLVASNPPNLEAQLLMASIEDSTNNSTAAIDLYSRVVAADSRNIVALNNLAFDLSKDDSRLDEALRHAQTAKELAPDNSYTLDTLGWIYFRKGLYTLAVKELELALAAGQRPSVQFHLGLTYKRLGENRKGDQLVATALAAQPDLIKTAPVR